MSVGLQYSINLQRMAGFVSMVNVLILTAALDVSVNQDTNSHLTELSVSVGHSIVTMYNERPYLSQ